jgi:UDP-glucuronate 4-epimerase
MRVLVTGAAGFIGNQVFRQLIDSSDVLIGIDNFNPYYFPGYKSLRSQTGVNDRKRSSFGFVTTLDILLWKKITFHMFSPKPFCRF